ncbi:hypothetical protein SAMN05216276_102546 [Streptosporangium subroseum]|uniref:Winged helix-turn helix n=1 Tax=Streptosporangium subroseum TaxID=106412 RepID=A0A239K2L6_9ACTN|nr:hypothetical protein SAMN05216276_102546 [Streptosporangium subroseum]
MAEPVRVRGLTDQEGQRLQQIVRRASTSSVRYRRAMMLPASAGGNRVPVIAQLVQADEDTVRDVIHRFNEISAWPAWTLAGREAVPACSVLTARSSPSRRPPPDRPSSASLSPTGRCTSSSPICGRCTGASSASAARPHAACSPAAASPSSAPRRGRSPQTPTGRRSWTGSRRSWTALRIGYSPLMSSAHSGSGPPAARAGPRRDTPSGIRPPTAAPTASPTSTALRSQHHRPHSPRLIDDQGEGGLFTALTLLFTGAFT